MPKRTKAISQLEWTHRKDEKGSLSKVGRARVQFESHDLQCRSLEDFMQKSFMPKFSCSVDMTRAEDVAQWVECKNLTTIPYKSGLVMGKQRQED